MELKRNAAEASKSRASKKVIYIFQSSKLINCGLEYDDLIEEVDEIDIQLFDLVRGYAEQLKFQMGEKCIIMAAVVVQLDPSKGCEARQCHYALGRSSAAEAIC